MGEISRECSTANELSTGPAVDFDGTARPKGPKFDIGAFEVE